MIEVVAAVNDDKVLEQNLLKSPMLNRAGVGFRAQRGFSSAGAAYNAAIRVPGAELVVFAHQDVYIPGPWRAQLTAAISGIEATDPGWAVIGLYGVTETGRHVGYVWSSGLDKLVGQPFVTPTRVDSVDELLVVVRRESGIHFDEALPGFHFYGTDIVQTAWSNGRSAYVVCAPVVHNSRPVVFLSQDYLSAYDYMRRKWKARLPIQNCIAPILDSTPNRCRQQIRYWVDSIRYRSVDRSRLDRNYDSLEISRRLGFESDAASGATPEDGEGRR